MFFREIFQLILPFFGSNIVMKKNLSVVGLLFLGLIAPSQNQSNSRRPFKFSLPSDVSETIEQRFLDMTDGDSSGYITRNIAEERREIGEARPMCDEERKSLNIRELVYLKNPNFLPAPIDLDFRKYNLLPRKIDVIRCVKRSQDNMESEATGAICRPENCRERKVDIGVFGRLKNETGNVWEFVGTLTAVPVACECFIRWKPEKCSRSLDMLSDY